MRASIWFLFSSSFQCIMYLLNFQVTILCLLFQSRIDLSIKRKQDKNRSALNSCFDYCLVKLLLENCVPSVVSQRWQADGTRVTHISCCAKGHSKRYPFNLSTIFRVYFLNSLKITTTDHSWLRYQVKIIILVLSFSNTSRPSNASCLEKNNIRLLRPTPEKKDIF